MGSPCAACHVTHWTGTIPKNGEIDYDLVRYYRSMDKFAITFHAYAFAYVGYVASEAVYLSSFGNKGYIIVDEDAYKKYGAVWGQRSGRVFVTDEEGLAMVMQQNSVEGVNRVLGTKFPADSALRVVEIDDVWSYNPQMPTSGNEYWIPGGYTIGGAPERIIAPLDISDFPSFPLLFK